jgi:glutamate synthase (NADPH/NADH) small chain
MDCGIPFCNTGCPVNNIIPDWNDLVYRGHWEQALAVLHSTNNFPDFTGRICPAPCEAACTLNINTDPVGIKSIEHAIVDKGWEKGWILPQPPKVKTGKTVAVVGSGPAGWRRRSSWRASGIASSFSRKATAWVVCCATAFPISSWRNRISTGASRRWRPRASSFASTRKLAASGAVDSRRALAGRVRCADSCRWRRIAARPAVPGRDLDGVHFAMDFLPQQNKVNAGDQVPAQIKATGKRVVVIGGGDTGSDCVGTSNRHGALSVTQFELMPQPPESENKSLTWPYWPLKLRTSSSHEEGCARDFAVSTKELIGENGKVKALKWSASSGSERPHERSSGQRGGYSGRSRAAGDGFRCAGQERLAGTTGS